MRLARAILCGAIMLSLSACGGSKPAEEVQPVEAQTSEQARFVQDMRMLCDAPNVQEVQDATPERRALVMAQYISDRLQSERAKALFAELAMLSPAERVARVRGVADEAGVDPCPIVGWMEPALASAVDAEASALAARSLGSSLPQAQIKAVIEQHRDEVRLCYEEALAQDPAVAGKLIVSFAVEPDGVVKRVIINESELPESVGECIAKAALRWTFPALGTQPALIHYPFVFSAPKR